MSMYPEKNKSTAALCRLISIILGVVLLIIGCISHFESAWVKPVYNKDNSVKKLYQFCDDEDSGDKKCPAIAMEIYFIAMIIATFIMSCVGLIAALACHRSRTWKYIDVGCHILAAILLIIAASLYIYSSQQINDNFADSHKNKEWNFRRPEKIAAATLTFIQALLYGITAIFTAKD